MTNITLENVSFSYDNSTKTVDNVSCIIEPGEFVCLVGPSGCGKSTLLRLIAGLIKEQHGTITIGGRVVSNKKQYIPPEQRNVGLVFQQPSLFPHLTIAENIRFGISALPKASQQEITQRLLKKVGLEDQQHKYPHMLSSGQHQRVALARALAPTPDIVLLDEPFSNLDDVLRRQIRREMLQVLKETGIATIMVTHEPEEALIMADRMILMNNRGKIHQQGKPDDLHDNPKDINTANFFGPINILKGEVKNNTIATPLGKVPQKLIKEFKRKNNGTVKVVTRPEGILLCKNNKNASATVTDYSHTGAGWLITAKLIEGTEVSFHHIYGPRPNKGEKVALCFAESHIFIM